MKFNAQAYGPGFPSAGRSLEVEANESGLRVETKELDDGAPRWGQVEIHKSGWDGSQLRLEWKGLAGIYSLNVGDAASAKEISKLAGAKSPVKKAKSDTGTRIFTHMALWGFVVVPLLLILVVVTQYHHVAAWAVSLISVEQEAKLGEIVFAQQKARLKLVEGPSLDMVKDIGGKLTQGSRYKFQFHVADDPSVNAFAMPGGYVVMHSGLLKLAGNAEEVAGVLAHEVQHVEQRHSLRGIAQSIGLYAVLTLVLGDLSGLASIDGDLIGLKFSRDHETEADREGLKALVAAKINPSGMRDFFGKMAEQSKIDLGIFSSHPASAERMKDMDAMIQALPEEARRLPPLTVDYAAIKASLDRPK